MNKKDIENIPSEPGVYLFRDVKGRLLYIGKALDLRKRVRSYFQKGADLGPKTRILVSKIDKVETITVGSEIEALLLEADLIKRLKPKYNQRWKDDKSYPLLEITKEDFPRVRITRSKKEGEYFGPFPKLRARDIKKSLRRIFPFRDCSKAKFRRYKKLGRGCLYFDMNLCPGPCFGAVTKAAYKKEIESLRRFLKGEGGGEVERIEKEMEKASREKRFERAAVLRDRAEALEKAQLGSLLSYFGEDLNLPEDRRRKELEAIKKVLGIKKAERIEAYDVSNTGGELPTGSMVVFEMGKPKKSDYRKFKIRSVEGPDDVSALREVLTRRFSRLGKGEDDSFSARPDLVLIDGGKGQLNVARKVLEEKGVSVPLASLAKKEETLYFFKKGRIEEDGLEGREKEPALRLFQRVRDESHRFALSYHKLLRGKDLFEE